jgi:hypothetical protein
MLPLPLMPDKPREGIRVGGLDARNRAAGVADYSPSSGKCDACGPTAEKVAAVRNWEEGERRHLAQ